MQRFKPIGIVIIILILGLFALIKIGGSSLTGPVKQLLLNAASESVNGTLTVGDIDLSVLGSVVVKNPILKDKAGKQIASASAVTVGYDFSDLISKRYGMDRVRKIVVEDGVFDLVRDKQERWNAGDSLLKKKSDETTSFRGQITLKNVTANVLMDTTKISFQKVEGLIDFASYPTVGIDLKTQNGSSVITAKGSWKQDGSGSIALKSDGANLTAFLPSVPLNGPVALDANVTGSSETPISKGSFLIPKGSLGTMAFSNATGNFTFQDSVLNLSSTKAAALGGTITTSGPVYPATLRYVQKVTGQSVDSTLLTDKDIQGRVDFAAEVRGQSSWDEANADGTFSMGPGSVSGISFSSMTGNFSKRGAQMRFYNIRAQIGGQMLNIGDAAGIDDLKNRFKTPSLPSIKTPTPAVPSLPTPKLPGLPRVF